MIEECIVCRREPVNVKNKNAVEVVKDGFVVGHGQNVSACGCRCFLDCRKVVSTAKELGIE